MLYPGQIFDSPVPVENFSSEDGNWVFIKESDHNKIMNYIKNTDPYEVRYDDNTQEMIIKINWLYYRVNRTRRINDLFIVNSDSPR